VWLANAGVLEFHTWHSRIDPQPDAQGVSNDAAASAKALERSLLNRPDYIFFDLDPYIFSGNEPPGAADRGRTCWRRRHYLRERHR
jgi:bifunctional non-homologous end joining protein LigD